MGTHTYEQTVKYEVARDLLNDRLAGLLDQRRKEEASASPDMAVIDRLELELDGVHDAISQLRVTDDAQMDAIIAASTRAQRAA